MNKNRIAQYCCAALVAAGIGLNIQNAIADYGIGENSLSLVADPGSNSGSNSNSNWNSNTDTWPDMSDSDSNGNSQNGDKYTEKDITCETPFTGTPGDTIIISCNGTEYLHVIGNSGKVSFESYGTECPPGGNDDCCPRSCNTPTQL